MAGFLRGRISTKFSYISPSYICRFISANKESNAKISLLKIPPMLFTLNRGLAVQQTQIIQKYSSNANGDIFFEKKVQEIRREVEYNGRAMGTKIRGALSALNRNTNIRSQDALLLLRCLGNLAVNEKPETRVKLAHSLWKKIENYGIDINILYHNALLKVYIENGVHFNPTDYLAKIKDAGLEPNRATYARLISGYCIQGDIDGASKILDLMKSNMIPVDEDIFNTLVSGHFKANDSDSAESILNFMKNAGVPPTYDTYTEIMKGYASYGNIEKVKQTFADATDAGMPFYPSNIFDVVIEACTSGHKNIVDEIIPLAPLRKGLTQDVVSAVYRLVALGFPEEAYKVFQVRSPEIINIPSDKINVGRFLIKAMVRNLTPIETVVAICKDMKVKNLNKDDVDIIALWALVYEKHLYAIDAIKIMKDEGKPIRIHYFWPIFKIFKNRNYAAKNIYAASKEMLNLLPPDTEVLGILGSYIIPAIKQSESDFAVICENLLECGFEQKAINSIKEMHQFGLI